jgi:hypothetical protein
MFLNAYALQLAAGALMSHAGLGLVVMMSYSVGTYCDRLPTIAKHTAVMDVMSMVYI